MNQTIFINTVEIEPKYGIQSVSQSGFRNALKSISRPFRIRGGADPMDEPTEDDQGLKQDSPEMYEDVLVQFSEAEFAIASDSELELLLGEAGDKDDQGDAPVISDTVPKDAQSSRDTSFDIRIITHSNLRQYLQEQQMPVKVDPDTRERFASSPPRWHEFLFHNHDNVNLDMEHLKALALDPANAQAPQILVLADGRKLQWLSPLVCTRNRVSVPSSSNRPGHHMGSITHSKLSISDDSKHIVIANEHCAILWNHHTGKVIPLIPLPQDGTNRDRYAQAVTFCPVRPPKAGTAEVHTTLFTAAGPKFVVVYQGALSSWNIHGTKLEEHDLKINPTIVEFSPNGTTMAVIDVSGGLWILAMDGTLCHHLTYAVEDMKTQAWELTYSPDGRFLLVIVHETIVLWDCDSGRRINTLKLESSEADSLQHVAKFFRHSDQYIVTGSLDGLLRIWDLHTGKDQVLWIGHDGRIREMAVSPDDQTVIAGTNFGRIVAVGKIGDRWGRKWEIDSARCYGPIRSLEYSHDGRFIASGAGDAIVTIWKADGGGYMLSFSEDKHQILSVTWTPDDRFVISSSADGTIRSWSVYDARRFL
ncbi:hypothetical protein EIP86_004882 [Pleurotus ostreatoroseus]|nr:hypothetical protein EIP86_004882 [Pleurotus ostreatoroseus]